MGEELPAPSAAAEKKLAMTLSVAAGVLLLVLKALAWQWTGSTAILSDLGESAAHLVAVGFAAYSLWLSLRPADATHLYGHAKIGFFSAGFEGAMIIAAAFYILYEAVGAALRGPELSNLSIGLALTGRGADVAADRFDEFLGQTKGCFAHALQRACPAPDCQTKIPPDFLPAARNDH